MQWCWENCISIFKRIKLAPSLTLYKKIKSEQIRDFSVRPEMMKLLCACVCMCVLSHVSHVWLFATLWTVAHETPLSMGFSRQKYWSRLPYLLPGDLPDLGIELTSFMSPALAGRFFLASATWEALRRKHRRQTLCNTGLRKRRHTDG